MKTEEIIKLLETNNIEPNEGHVYIMQQATLVSDWPHHYGSKIVLTSDYSAIPNNTPHHAIAKNRDGKTVWGFKRV